VVRKAGGKMGAEKLKKEFSFFLPLYFRRLMAREADIKINP
jgi:hypothetical protein